MKVKVIKEFIDKHSKQFYGIGTELDITNDRFAEIQEAGQYVVLSEQNTEPKKNHCT